MTRSLDLTQSTPQETIEQPRQGLPWGMLIVYTILILGAIFSLLPFFWMVGNSVMSSGEIATGRVIPRAFLEGDFDTLVQQARTNYTQAWVVSNFAQYMRNSFIIAAISIGGMLLVCIPAAYAFARMDFFGKDFLFAVTLSTMMIPEIVNVAPNLLTVVWFGRLSETLCNSTACGWTNNWPALTVPFWASAFTVFLLRQFFAQIPNDLWDAARIDGAGHFLFMWRIVMPLSRAAIVTVIVFAFIGSWNALIWPLMVIQDDTWRPVAAGLTKFITQDEPGGVNLHMAASIIMMLPVLVLYFVAQRQFTEGFTSSGLKG